MLKKVITLFLLLCLIFSVSAMAVDTVPEIASETQQGTRERPSRGRGNMAPSMGEKPQGEFDPSKIPEGFTPPEGEKPQGDFDPSKIPEGFTPPEGEMPQGDFDPSKMPEGFTPPEGDLTPSQNSGEFTPPQSNESNNTQTSAPKINEGVAEENSQPLENDEKSEQAQKGNLSFGGQMPEGMGGFPANMQSRQNTAIEQPTGFLGFVKTYSTPITSVVLLGLAYLFVVFYKRKHY